MTEFSVTIPTATMSWEELKRAVEVAGVPATARFKLHEYKSFGHPTDYDQEKIVFTWRSNG